LRVAGKQSLVAFSLKDRDGIPTVEAAAKAAQSATVISQSWRVWISNPSTARAIANVTDLGSDAP